MADCTSVDSAVTPYIDDELGSAERQLVDHHLRICAACRARVAAERAVRDLIGACRSDLSAERASPALRAKCQGLKTPGVGPPAAQVLRASSWAVRLMPPVLAASLIVVVGGTFVYEVTQRSSRLMAAELTADHVKCFGMNSLLGTHDAPTAVEQSMLAGFGWRLHVDELERTGLELVGSRPCFYGEGRVAHLMYHHDGRPVSIFMLPKKVRSDELIEVMGHEAAVWSVGGRTFVLIAREPRAEVERMASIVQAALR